MLPIILVSDDEKETRKYVKSLQKQLHIMDSFLYEFRPEKAEIVLEQIRELRSIVRISSSHTRMYIIHSFETASTESQNALLKTLEESTEKNQFILVATNIHTVLSTLVSRSKVVLLKSNAVFDEKDMEELTAFINRIETTKDFSFLLDPYMKTISKDTTEEFFFKLLYYYQQKLKRDNSLNLSTVGIIKKILTQRKLFLDNNLNATLAVDALLIFIAKVSRMKERG